MEKKSKRLVCKCDSDLSEILKTYDSVDIGELMKEIDSVDISALIESITETDLSALIADLPEPDFEGLTCRCGIAQKTKLKRKPKTRKSQRSMDFPR